MPIDLTCSCGRALVLRDELAGQRIRCPECRSELTVPAGQPKYAPAAEPVLEVLPVTAADDPMALRAEEPRAVAPRPRRMDLRDQSLAPPKPNVAKGGGGFGSTNASIGGGLLMMVIAVVWFVVGFFVMNVTFIYPPILFVIGLVAFIRGLVKGSESN